MSRLVYVLHIIKSSVEAFLTQLQSIVKYQSNCAIVDTQSKTAFYVIKNKLSNKRLFLNLIGWTRFSFISDFLRLVFSIIHYSVSITGSFPVQCLPIERMTSLFLSQHLVNFKRWPYLTLNLNGVIFYHTNWKINKMWTHLPAEPLLLSSVSSRCE